MLFATPIWLILLAPWGLLVVWMLLGRRENAPVPFLPLWENTGVPATTRRSLRPPPLAVVLMLAAILAAILGAAGPRWRGGASGPLVALIIDRGITMSAGDRLAVTPQRAREELSRRGIRTAATLFVPPGDASPVAIKTDALLRAAVVDLLQRSDLPIVVVSDQPDLPENGRVVRVSPEKPAQNVGIVRLAARATPRAQAMVRVRNQSSFSDATLTVRSGDASRSQTIKLPERDGQQDFFIDLPRLGQIIQATLELTDDLPIDNVAWLVRRRSWPKIDRLDPLPPEVQRMVEVYRKNRPSGQGSTTVVLASQVAHLSANVPGIALAGELPAAPADPAQLKITAHELTRDLDWKALAVAGPVAGAPPGEWTPLVTAGDRVLLAVRDATREVFLGIDPRAVADSEQFVVLWGKLFDWAGRGGELYDTSSVHAASGWQLIESDPSSEGYDAPRPGVYRDAQDALAAMSAIDVDFASPPPDDLSPLDQLAYDRAAWKDMRPAMLFGAIIALLSALAALRK